jgi:hypothetical protein
MDQVKEFINGRVQSEKIPGGELNAKRDGDVGLFTSRYRSDSEGVKDNAGDIEDRMRDFEE